MAQQRLAELEQARARIAQWEVDLKKKWTGGGGSEDLIPVGGSTPLGVIAAARRLVMAAGVSLRAVPRVFEVLLAGHDPNAPAPSPSGVRWWLLRMGLFALREPLEIADDWVYSSRGEE